MRKTNNRITYNEMEKKKIIFQFSLVSLFSFASGIIFVSFASHEFLSYVVQNIFYASAVGGSFTNILLKKCSGDIFVITGLFVFSFSYINYLITDFALFYWGFKLGFYSRIFYISHMSYRRMFAHITAICILLVIYLVFSCSLAIKTLYLVKHRANGRVSFDKRCLLSIMVLSISALGATFVINSIGLII